MRNILIVAAVLAGPLTIFADSYFEESESREYYESRMDEDVSTNWSPTAVQAVKDAFEDNGQLLTKQIETEVKKECHLAEPETSGI